MKIATFGAGCFWGVEHHFRQLPGVTDVIVGYMGGTTVNPTYSEVCRHQSGHAEVVQVHYNAEKISYVDLLNAFWTMHNPTQLNYQGFDRGTQYRSVIFYHDEEQKNQAVVAKHALDASKKFSDPIATAIEPAQTFYRAEEEHQRYYEKHGKSCS